MSINKIEKEVNGEIVELVESTQIIPFVFSESVTETTLRNLRKQYPKKLNLDMTIEADFKAARKIKTQRNKVAKDINDKRISYCNDVKAYGDNLIIELDKIYTPYISAFEIEDKRRKEETARIAKEREAFLNKQRQKIADISYFIEQCKGQPTKFIADTIESVDLIETDTFDKEIIHEAIGIKKEVLETLSGMYQAAKAAEAVALEREKLRIQQEAMAQKERLQKQAQEIEQRINNLRNDPMNFFGKPSQDVAARIQQLGSFTPSEDRFGSRTNEVSQVLVQVIQQLTMMHTQQLQVEQAQQATSQAEAQQIEQLQADVTRAAEQDAATERAEQHQALEEVDRILEQNEPLLGNGFKSPVFENGEKLGYDPLDVWPSDSDRAGNDELDRICNQLMRAESYIEILEKRLNKALTA
ncbi:chromosome segregation protein [Pseudoalteromonas phage vB_Pun_Y3]